MKFRHDFWIVKISYFCIFSFSRSEIIVFVLLLLILYCNINKLILSVTIIISFYFRRFLNFDWFSFMNFFVIFLFLKITIERLTKYFFSVLAILIFFFTAFSSSISLISDFFSFLLIFCCCCWNENCDIYIWIRKFVETTSFFVDILLFCSINSMMFLKAMK